MQLVKSDKLNTKNAISLLIGIYVKLRMRKETLNSFSSLGKVVKLKIGNVKYASSIGLSLTSRTILSSGT